MRTGLSRDAFYRSITLGLVLIVGILGCSDLVFQTPEFNNPYDPNVAFTSLAWVQATESAPVFPRIDFGTAVFDDRIWVAGGRDDSGAPLEDIWSSSDGQTWTQTTTEGPLIGTAAENPAFTAFGGELFLYGLGDMYVSVDGVSWTQTTVPFSGDFVRFVKLDGRLWAVSPQTGEIMSSDNPVVWDSWTTEDGGAELGTAGSTGTTVTAHGGAIWMIGRSLIDDIYRYVPGSGGWELVDSSGIYNRERAQVVSYGGDLWMMGGLLEPEGLVAVNDVWRVEIGNTTEILPRPEWEPRERFGTAVFNGRIFLFGGSEEDTTGMHTDVWQARGQ